MIQFLYVWNKKEIGNKGMIKKSSTKIEAEKFVLEDLVAASTVVVVAAIVVMEEAEKVMVVVQGLWVVMEVNDV